MLPLNNPTHGSHPSSSGSDLHDVARAVTKDADAEELRERRSIDRTADAYVERAGQHGNGLCANGRAGVRELHQDVISDGETGVTNYHEGLNVLYVSTLAAHLPVVIPPHTERELIVFGDSFDA